MQVKVYALRDAKAEAFLRPMFALNDGMALRAFEEDCQRPESEAAKHPQDFALFRIGTYDDATAALVPEQQPVSIGLAVEYVKMAE